MFEIMELLSILLRGYLFISFYLEHRVAQGGHFVSEEDIKRRYYRSKKLFLEVKNYVDSWSLIFNGEDDFVLVAKNNQIYINELYKKFLEDLSGE